LRVPAGNFAGGHPSGARIRTRGTVGVVALALLGLQPPAPAAAQLTSPCEIGCALVLGATGFTVATGALVARGRHTGGVSSTREVMGVWGGTFVVFVGSGVALSGNGERQERAVYAAGIGALAGSLVWLGIESSLSQSNGARRVAASLMGAAVGAVIGGVYGALSHDGTDGGQVALFDVRLRF